MLIELSLKKVYNLGAPRRQIFSRHNPYGNLIIFILLLVVLINESVHAKMLLLHWPTARAQTGLHM